MKFLHLADLHLGKLIDDQKYILDKILEICAAENPDGVIIAGDVYDKTVPTAEAVELFDRFLSELHRRKITVLSVSGNHDSAERLGFGSALMSEGGAYFSPVYSGNVEPVILKDGYGEVAVYLLPFIKPSTVRRFFGDRQIESYTDAVGAAIEAMDLDLLRRNVLVAHQFVTGSLRSGSEEFNVGDVGNVDAAVFSPFDYVALGHIHGAQNVGSEKVRYAGAPLKYSLSEAGKGKSVTVVEIKEKGSLSVRCVPLVPMRDMVEIRGKYEEITNRNFYGGTTLNVDLVHIVLTDENEAVDALGKLRLIYPNVMSVRYDNARARAASALDALDEVPARTPSELFSSLYEAQNGKPMTFEQSALIGKLIEKVWGEDK